MFRCLNNIIFNHGLNGQVLIFLNYKYNPLKNISNSKVFENEPCYEYGKAQIKLLRKIDMEMARYHKFYPSSNKYCDS